MLKYYQLSLTGRLNIRQRQNLLLKLHSVENVVFVKFYPNVVLVFYKDVLNKIAVLTAFG